MSAGAPWSVKGIDPKAREVAKDHARRCGMTLGAWLNHVILEDDPAEGAAPTPDLRDRAAPDLARIAQALDRITDRIEASETRTGLAINSVEHSIRQALARIETAERAQHAAVIRLEGSLAEAATETGDFGDRLRRLEGEGGPRQDEALRALEGRMARAEPEAVVEVVLRRLGERLAAAEARTAEALDALKVSLSNLDQRLGSVEREASAPTDQAFEALGQVLAHRVDAVRAEVAQRLRETAGGGAVESRLAEMAGHVAAAEARSTKAVEAIGRQVLAMAEAVGRKLSEVDQRGAEAIDQVGTEVARIAGAVELRLARGEQAQAQAFDRLTADLTRATARIEAEQDRERGPGSGTLPDGAMDEVHAAIGPPPEPEPESELDLELASEPEPEPRLAPEPPSNLPAVAVTPFGPELFSRAEAEPAAGPQPQTIHAPWRKLDTEEPGSGVANAFAPIDEIESELFETARETPSANGPQLSTREVIEQARAAARAQRGDEVPLEVGAKVEPKAATGRLFQGFGGRPRRDNTALQTALMIAGGAAFFSVSAAGLTLLQGQTAREQARAQPGVTPAPRAAMALSGAAAAPARAAVAPAPFSQVHADVEAGVPGALEKLQALAAAGHSPAQLYLGQLYDEGQAGLPKDPARARRLTALAAEAGDAKAMHNLGVYEFQGEGGPVDPTSAARWFRKAADAGVVESQYNLGLLYQAGTGVVRDPEQARQWFRRAATGGDVDARRALAALVPPARTAPARSPLASPNVQQAQAILTRLGYYEGPADGHATEAYKVALFRYQKDQRDQSVGPKPYLAER